MELSVQNLVTGNEQCEWNVNIRPRIESKRMCVMMVHDNTGEIRRQSLIRRRWLQLGKHGWRPRAESNRRPAV
jgi:hypothetical protein